MPSLSGCENASNTRKCTNQQLIDFIDNHLRYPPIAKENGVEGTVVVQFIITKEGNIKDIKVIRDIGANCGKEAIRLIKLMIAKSWTWKPGTQSGKPVDVQYNLPIRFKLD